MGSKGCLNTARRFVSTRQSLVEHKVPFVVPSLCAVLQDHLRKSENIQEGCIPHPGAPSILTSTVLLESFSVPATPTLKQEVTNCRWRAREESQEVAGARAI